MEQFFKMPKQKMPRSRINHPGGRIQGSFRNTPSLGTIKPAIDHFGKKPAFHQTGIDLRALLRSRHTRETLHRGKHGPDMRHGSNLFDTAHHAGGMGAVRAAYHGGNKFKVDHSKQKFTYQNHMGTQVKVPAGWKVDSFGSAYDPTKPHAM